MHQIHGFVEYRQLEEWYGVVHLGSLLVPNAALSALLLEVARHHRSLHAPADASVAFEEQYSRVRQHAAAAGTLSYNEARALETRAVAGARQDEVALLLHETLFDTVLELCGVLARKFGEGHVRLVFYFD